MEFIQIAVDGPAGSGKTSIMRAVANEIGFSFIDTGLMYRAFTKFLINQNVNFENKSEIISQIKNFHCEFINEEVYVNGENYMEFVMKNDVLENINKVTTIPEIREFMVEQQRIVAGKLNCVLTGRDITTVVLPDAKIKIYLDCSIEARAKRRLEQNIQHDIDQVEYDVIYKMIKERDESDMNRTVGPLKIADDAIVIDNSTKTFDECVREIIKIVKGK
jgi:cytidylate kinase